MILYLTRDVRINLLDFLEMEHELPIKKLVGNFSLLSFVIKDMRHFAHARYVVLDRVAVTESDEELIQALQSYQTIYDMRVVIIAEGLPQNSPLLLKLIQINVLNIVTANDIEGIQAELRECLSEEGMQLFQTASHTLVAETELHRIFQEEENVQYHFNCSNLKIAIAGCDRRMGVTTTAMNLVCWINTHGGSACYVESNSNNHLAHIIHLFEPEKIGHAYILEGNDLYMTKELNQDYNVIVLDCGVLAEKDLHDVFTTADLRVLCGSAMPYELASFYKTLNRCDGFPTRALGLFVPDDIKPYLVDSISHDILFGEDSHDLFDSRINNNTFKNLLKAYII